MAETVVLSAAERRQSLSVAIACITVFGITVAVTSPLISLILEARGVSGTVIGAMAAVPAVSLLLTNPLIPLAVRKVGLRRFLYSCIALQLVLTLLMPVFDHIVAWFILRALAGAAVNGLFVASETWINLVAEERSRGRVLAFYGMALSASFAAGPLLITVTGIEGPLPFCVIAGTIFLAGLPLFMARGLSPVVQGTASFGVFSF
ncbi:MAG: MFS transporter, partial [Pseudomonadota bacterium]